MAVTLTKRWQTRHGYLYIQDDECKGCNFCIEFCPKQVLERSGHFNAKGYYPPRVKDARRCANCTFCQLICPDFAIWSVKEPVASGHLPDVGASTSDARSESSDTRSDATGKEGTDAG